MDVVDMLENEEKKEAPVAENGSELSFEDAYARLEQIVSRMESGKLTLEESVKAYEEGAKLVKYCESELAKYEEVIKNLAGN